MSKRVESEQYYITFEMFTADVRRMFGNARTYNAPETIYYKCATRYDAADLVEVPSCYFSVSLELAYPCSLQAGGTFSE